ACAPLRVLLADDNPINRKVGVALLAQLGHPVDVVTNGAEVLSAIGSRAYDVVLLDVQMPVMDGYETARRIRSPGGGLVVRPRVIAMTANARAVDRERCLEAGMDDFLAKPLRLDALQVMLDSVVSAREMVTTRSAGRR